MAKAAGPCRCRQVQQRVRARRVSSSARCQLRSLLRWKCWDGWESVTKNAVAWLGAVDENMSISRLQCEGGRFRRFRLQFSVPHLPGSPGALMQQGCLGLRAGLQLRWFRHGNRRPPERGPAASHRSRQQPVRPAFCRSEIGQVFSHSLPGVS